MIISKVGAVAYKLQLSDTCRVHPVFHISQLKRVISNAIVQTTLPLEFEREKLEWLPEEVLAYKTVRQHHSAVPQVLIKWQSRPKEEATWEDFLSIKEQFLNFQLEDKSALLEGGNDRDITID